ncbi:claudin-23 [Osmerus mordax]|uniref:claudin-23 n=1 Tax=Osmerus mordax TaxID=8014 RepID=UPI00350E8E1B
MHTPVSMVMGIVFAPLGLVLVFTAAITPQWREGHTRLGVAGPGAGSRVGSGVRGSAGSAEALLLLRSDGLWESCLQVAESELRQCWPVAGSYERDPRVRLAQGLVLSSLFMCGAGIVLASVGVRCWTDIPLRSVAAAGGLLVALAGLLSLTALGVYTHSLGLLGQEERGHGGVRLPPLHLHPGGSLYFGWLGACVQVLGGSALLLSFKRPECPSCPCCITCLCCLTCPRPCPHSVNKQGQEVYEISC